jgi:hypothetical protein
VLVLWTIAALLAAGLTAALLIPRGNTTRSGVAAYIDKVNATGRAFAGDYRGVSKAYQAFTLAPQRSSNQLARLRAAAAKLTKLRVELAAIPAPPAAHGLRKRLIAFYRQQEAVGYELVGITDYVPRLTAAERSLGPASTRMRKALASGRTPAKQAAALGTYGQAVAATVTTLRAIHPPPLFAASHRAQIASLRHSARALANLQHALLTHSRAKVKAAVAALQVAPTAKAATSRAAVLAYNRHVARIHALGAAVERERLRLNRVLG